TANYVITATIAAPALIQLHVPVIAAHMFVFYFGIIADITPPVALAAYAASGISGGNPMKTGVVASKLAIAAFIVPYIFVYAPVLLMVNATPAEVVMSAISAVTGMFGLGVAMIGYWYADVHWFVRIISFAAGLMLIEPGLLTSVIGIVLLIGIYFIQSKKGNTQKKIAA
ncbi:MAG: C4-dicarboxylate transporter, partial [Firmicutes bacterium]|nr:C4-dicarboxylate transporter [Bacillota bacterium]